MNICDFIEIYPDEYECSKCGLKISSFDGPPIFPCSSIDESDFEELQNKGLVCSKKEIQNRYNICTSCEYFSNLTCKQCGCIVTRNTSFKNKLLWKDHECPIGKWKKN